jgi:hypothetical protein
MQSAGAIGQFGRLRYGGMGANADRLHASQRIAQERSKNDRQAQGRMI